MKEIEKLKYGMSKPIKPYRIKTKKERRRHGIILTIIIATTCAVAAGLVLAVSYYFGG